MPPALFASTGSDGSIKSEVGLQVDDCTGAKGGLSELGRTGDEEDLNEIKATAFRVNSSYFTSTLNYSCPSMQRQFYNSFDDGSVDALGRGMRTTGHDSAAQK